MAIDIKITDGIASGIDTKLDNIARAAGLAETRTAALQKTLNKLSADNLRALSRAQLDQSKYNVNQAKADYYNTRAAVEKEKQIAEKIKQSGLATKNAQEQQRQAALTASTKVQQAEKAAQAQIATANAQLAAKTKQAQAAAQQAEASRKIQYTNELGRYTPQMARATASISTSRADVASAGAAAANSKAAQAAANAAAAQAKANNEVAKGATIAARTATAQNNLAASANRAAISQTNLAAATTRAAASQTRSQNSVTRSQASLSSYLSSLNNTSRASAAAVSGLNNTSAAMNRLETSASFLRSDGLRWAKVLWALGGATLTAHAVVGAADAYTRLQNRLTVVSESQAQVNGLTKEMGRIAITSRQPIETTAKLYTRLDLAMRDLGESQATTAKLTESISKGLQLTGATAGEAASAMLQISQAFNKGKLDGDEFRSVMENAPILADALAKSLNVTRGELLKLAPQGKLTAKKLTDAWVDALPRIQEAFAKTRTTIEQGFTVFRTQMIMYFGELDKSLGLTNAISKAIMALGNNLDTLAFAFMAIAPVIAAFVGAKVIAGLGIFTGFVTRTAVAIGAIRSPITVVSAALLNMTRNATASGVAMVGAFTSANTRAIALQLTVVRLAAGVVALTTIAQRAGAALLGMFSFGNVLLMLTVATAAALAFGDAMIVSAEKGTTMRDYTIAAFSVMADYVGQAFNDTFDYVSEGFDGVGKKSETTGSRVLISLGAVADGAASMTDNVLTLINWVGHLIAAVATALLQTAQNIAKTVINIFSTVTNVITGAIDLALRGLAQIASFAGRIGNLFGGNYDTDVVAPQIGQIQLLGVSYDETAAALAKLNNQQEIGVDIAKRSLATYKEDVRAKAGALAKERATTNNLREADAKKQAAAAAAADKAAKGKDKKGKKGRTDEEKRADMIQKVIDAENQGIRTSKLYGDERERVAIVEKLADDIRRKGFAELNAQEKDNIRGLVTQRLEAERVGKALQSIYETVKSPKQEYDASLTALNQLKDAGEITAQQFELLRFGINDTFRAATDGAYAAKKELAQLRDVFGLFGAEAVAQKAVYDAIESAQKTGARVDVVAVYDTAKATYNLQQQQSALNSQWEAGAGALEKLRFAQEALDAARSKGQIGAQSYMLQSAGNSAQMGTINEQMFGLTDPVEPIRRGMYQLLAEMPTLGQGMATAITSTLGNAIDGISETMTSMVLNFDKYAESVAEALDKPVSTLDVLRYALGDIINQIGKEMVNALIKMGVQWAIQATLQKALGAANSAAAISQATATGAAITAAMTPAAATASVATMGTAPTTGAVSFAAAMASMLAAIPAFADGGYISGAGTGRSDSILARVSNGEMVMNAKAVDRHRPMLEAVNSGMTLGGGSINTTNINIVYNGDGKGHADVTGDQELAMKIRDFVDAQILQREQERQQQGHEGYLR